MNAAPVSLALWKGYLAERFPLGAYLVLVGAMVLAAVAAASDGAGIPVGLLPVVPLSTLAILAFFFLLRVFDEHKDFAGDRVAHPNRLLSRGLITLPSLARAGVAVGVLAVGIAFVLGLQPGLWMCAALGFAVLMRYEFFVGPWLRQHIVIYAITHNPVVALLMMVPVSAISPESACTTPVILWLVIASASSLGFEVGRKLRAPEDEKPLQDTYTQSLGIPRAVALLVFVETLIVAASGRLVLSPITQGVIGAAFLFALVGPLQLRKSRSAASAKLAEGGATVLALVVYLAVATDIMVRRGFSAWN